MLVVVHHYLMWQKFVTWWCNVNVMKVGKDSPILSHHSNPYIVGQTLKSHSLHTSYNITHFLLTTTLPQHFFYV